MLKMTIIGNIGADANSKFVKGKQVISFKVAHNEKYTKDGVKHEKSVWVDCSIWREKETALINYLKRGQKVYLEGTPSADAYQSKEDGSTVSVLRLNVRHLELL